MQLTSVRTDPRKAGSLLGSEGSQELVLLLDGLEAAVTILGGGVDELKVEGLHVGSSGSGHQRLAEGHSSLASAGDTALDHEPVLVDFTVVREATHGGDALLGKVSLSGSGLVVALLANSQDALVDLRAVMVALLTSSRHGEADAGGMPSSDTGNLAQTSVGLAGKAGDAPTTDDTSESVTAGSGAHIHHLTLLEHLAALHFLLEQGSGEVNLGADISSVDLDLEEIGGLLSELHLADLSVSETRTTWQYWRMRSISASISFGLSAAFFAYLVKAFLLERYQFL